MYYLWGEGRGRGNALADSALSVEPDVGLDLTTLGSGPLPKLRVGQLTDRATQAPQFSEV